MNLTTKSGWHVLFWIAILCFAPIAIITAIIISNTVLAHPLANPETGLSNLGGTALLLRHLSAGFADSWRPMQTALSVIHDPHTHSQLYETLFYGIKLKFQYPPTSLLPLDILQHLGLSSISALNKTNFVVFVVNALALAWLGFLLFGTQAQQAVRASSRSDRVIPVGIAIIVFVAAFVYSPLVKAKLLGQIQLWIDLLTTIAVLCWFTNKRFIAGVLIGLACLIKPQAAIFLIWAVAWGEWKLMRGILTAAVPLLLVSITIYGLHNHIEYLRVLSYLSAHGESYFSNNSMNGLMNRLLGNGNDLIWHWHRFPPFNPIVYSFTLGFGLLCLAAILLPAWGNRGRATILDFAIVFICSVISSPIAWQHHYGVLAPLYIVVLRAWMSASTGWRKGMALAALTVSWTLVATLIPQANLVTSSPFNIVQSYVFFGALILLGLIFWRQMSVARPAPAAHPGPLRA